MAKIKSKKTSKRKTRRKNPNWSLKSLFNRKKGGKGDSIFIQVMDGDIILTGKELPKNYETIFSILENDLKDFRIEFQPDGSNKKYVINRPLDLRETSDRRREMLSTSAYFSMPRSRPRRIGD
jgi:hypothetical protein